MPSLSQDPLAQNLIFMMKSVISPCIEFKWNVETILYVSRIKE